MGVYSWHLQLTLNAPIATKVFCFSRLLKCLRSLSMTNSVDPDQTAPIASILNLSVMLDNYLQKTTSADDIFRYIFFQRHKYQNLVCWPIR